jgi:hypothetical protein
MVVSLNLCKSTISLSYNYNQPIELPTLDLQLSLRPYLLSFQDN